MPVHAVPARSAPGPIGPSERGDRRAGGTTAAPSGGGWPGCWSAVAAAGWTASTGSLGRGVLLAVPVGALCVLAGVVVGELRVTAPDRAIRSAAIEFRRVRDHLPGRLTALVAASLGLLVAVLVWTTSVGSAEDLGRAGRVLARQCTPVLSEARSPWPGAYYSLPLLTLVVGGVLVAAWSLHLIVRRPRQGEDQIVDDALRRRAARAIVAAVGLLVAVPAAGVTLVASITLAGSSCPTGWDAPVALLLGLSAPALLVLAGGCAVVLLAPTRMQHAGTSAEPSR